MVRQTQDGCLALRGHVQEGETYCMILVSVG